MNVSSDLHRIGTYLASITEGTRIQPDTLRRIAAELSTLATLAADNGAYDDPVLQRVATACAAAWDCEARLILSRAQIGNICDARNAAVHLYAIIARTSLSRTAQAFGGRDPCCAQNSVRRCRDYLDTDPDFRRRYLAAAAALGLSPEAALVPPAIRNPKPTPHPTTQ